MDLKNKINSLFSYFDNNLLLKNFVFSFFTLLILFFFILKFLDIYTLHDKYIKVPNFSQIHISKIDSIASSNDLRFVIIDSVSDPNRQKGIVISQDPISNTNVKKKSQGLFNCY